VPARSYSGRVARNRGKHAAPDDPRPGERLVRAGALVFAVGVVGALLAVVPFFFGRQDAPSWTALTASLLPVGLGLALVGLLVGARSRRGAS
jgi:VIT1/CCC1 family predicted Fe2+/Mn2+ transporter